MKIFCGVIHAECGKRSCQGCLIAEKWAAEKHDEWEEDQKEFQKEKRKPHPVTA